MYGIDTIDKDDTSKKGLVMLYDCATSNQQFRLAVVLSRGRAFKGLLQ